MSPVRFFVWVIIGLSFGVTIKPTLRRMVNGILEAYLNKTLKEDLPNTFDARENWPHCSSIRQISDQGSTDYSWAVSAADAMTDRICIHSLGEHKYRLSAANLINCCIQCVDKSAIIMAKIRGGIGGVSYAEAWKYWIKNGIVTGGPYGSNESCQPYEFEPCKHFTTNDLNTANANTSRKLCKIIHHTPNCRNSCQPFYETSYTEDKNYGREAYRIRRDELAIRTEILLNGPVQAFMQLFGDFSDHESGLYYHKYGRYSHMHAVRIIGWGHDNENTPYWLAANSYGTDWGENGFFRIKRGVDECLIESNVAAGLPKYQPLLKNQQDILPEKIFNTIQVKLRT